MRELLLFAVLGCGTGAIYAGLGLGLVVQYKASGVLNFAYAAMAMVGAYMFDHLRRTGQLVLPWVGVPYRLQLGSSFSMPAATAIVLPVLGLLGLAIYLLVLRPLRAAPGLAKVVAMIGLLLAMQALVSLQYGTQAIAPTPVLPNQGIDVFGQQMPRDRFFLVAIIVLLACVLWAVFRFTRFGLATRAAAETERGALLIGISPTVIGATNWVLSAIGAGVLGILISPITALDPSVFPLFVVPALAAALVGRLNSLGVTALGGIVLGIAQSELIYLSTQSWFPGWAQSGAGDALPFLIIVVALFVVGKRLPRRGELVADRSPESLRRQTSYGSLTVWLAGCIILLVALHSGYRFALLESIIGAVIMLSFVVLTGFLGQISLAQAAFAGTGGFMLAHLADSLRLPFPIAPLLAVLCGTLLGLVVGVPALRIRGVQLAVATLGASVAIEDFVFDNQTLSGGLGGVHVPELHIFGVDIGPYAAGHFPSIRFGIFCIVVLAVASIVVANVRRSSLGRRMLAVRSNEQAAAAAGVDVVKVKLVGFALASLLASLAGVLTGYLQIDISSDSFTTFVSIEFFAIAYLGGITSISGAYVGGFLVAGGLLATICSQVLHIAPYYPLLGGLGVTLAAIQNPEGLADRTSAHVRYLVRRLRRGRVGGGAGSDDAPPPLRQPLPTATYRH